MSPATVCWHHLHRDHQNLISNPGWTAGDRPDKLNSKLIVRKLERHQPFRKLVRCLHQLTHAHNNAHHILNSCDGFGQLHLPCRSNVGCSHNASPVQSIDQGTALLDPSFNSPSFPGPSNCNVFKILNTHPFIVKDSLNVDCTASSPNFRLPKSFRMPFLANMFLRFLMIFLWFADMIFLCWENDLWFFYGFEYGF